MKFSNCIINYLLIYLTGDKLPYVHEVVTAIKQYAPGGSPYENNETRLRKDAINSYVRALILTWAKAFGEEHISPRKVVAGKIRKHIIDHHLRVVKKKPNESKRERLTKWRQDCNVLFNILRQASDPEMFDNNEKLFFYGQISPRRSGYISDQIDLDHVEFGEQLLLQQTEEIEEANRELSYIEEGGSDSTDSVAVTPCSSTSTVVLNQSLNRSGLTRKTTNYDEKCIQTDNCIVDIPPIRKTKNCTNDIKAACTKVSVECGLSVEKSRVAVQTACKYLYHHDYYLNIDDARKSDGNTLPPNEGTSTSIPSSSSSTTTTSTSTSTTAEDPTSPPTKKKRIVSKSDYMDYKYVLPSAKTIANFKQLQSADEERQAAIALLTKPDDVKTTFHFDTTSRSTIDGEWALLLIFSDNRRFSLRPIYFAYEDRENIVSLISETY